jgi:hypothetical protein
LVKFSDCNSDEVNWNRDSLVPPESVSIRLGHESRHKNFVFAVLDADLSGIS